MRPGGCGIRRALVLAVGLAAGAGCSRESLRVALDAQRRADQVQQHVFEQQQDALRVLMYRDLVRRLGEGGVGLNEAQRAAMNEVWNDRDLLELWAVQHERAQALRIAGVDAKLFSDQSVVDLLWKALRAKVQRGEQGLAGALAERVME